MMRKKYLNDGDVYYTDSRGGGTREEWKIFHSFLFYVHIFVFDGDVIWVSDDDVKRKKEGGNVIKGFWGRWQGMTVHSFGDDGSIVIMIIMIKMMTVNDRQ